MPRSAHSRALTPERVPLPPSRSPSKSPFKRSWHISRHSAAALPPLRFTPPDTHPSEVPTQDADQPTAASASSRVPSSRAAPSKGRAPAKGCSYKSNPLRPHVLAADRLRYWTTPYALAHSEHLAAGLPSPLLDLIEQHITDHLTPKTRATYAAGLLRFTQFCDLFHIPEFDRMPASYPLLTAFILHHKGNVSGQTVKAWLSGLRAWHEISDAPWYGDARWVQMARSIARKEGAAFTRPPRQPLTVRHLHILRRALTLSDSFHAAVWAVATVTFFGVRRLGETTVATVSQFDPKYHVTRSTTIEFPGNSVNFHIPWTKTTHERGATVTATARGDGLCPVAAMRNHLSVNSTLPPHASLFAYRKGSTTSSPWQHMAKAKFFDFCRSLWEAAGLPAVLGHSLRIGGAVELLLNGVPPEVVAAAGGWTSLAFLLYWRRVETIVPQFTASAYRRAELQRASESMQHFQTRVGIPESLLVDDEF